MDQPYMDHNIGDYLHQDRSTIAAVNKPRSEPLKTTETSTDSSPTGNTPSSTSVPSLATNFSSESESSPFLTGPLSKSYTSHPLSGIDQKWSYPDSSKASETPVLLVEEPRDSVAAPKTTAQVTRGTSLYAQHEMSTLGVQFDPHFDAGNRTSYTWPLFDMNEPYGSQEMTSLDPFNISNTMSYAKSLSSSPPQAMSTPEQRELKRQRDRARRESKTKQRRERSASNSYNASQTTTPDLIPRSLSSYPSMPSASLPNESSPTFASTSFIPPLAPHLSSSESPELFGAPFPLMSNDFGVGGGGFMMPFTSAAEQTIPSYTPRPHSLSSASDQPYFYRGSTIATQESLDTVRIVTSRPKPQCWEHGCNGRQFSTFSNLLRHQREKSGVSSKPSCPKCGAEFTRTTARNGHMAHEKCKPRRNSDH